MISASILVSRVMSALEGTVPGPKASELAGARQDRSEFLNAFAVVHFANVDVAPRIVLIGFAADPDESVRIGDHRLQPNRPLRVIFGTAPRMPDVSLLVELDQR